MGQAIKDDVTGTLCEGAGHSHVDVRVSPRLVVRVAVFVDDGKGNLAQGVVGPEGLAAIQAGVAAFKDPQAPKKG